MSVLKKTVNGLLYYEDFSDPNSLMWTLSPSHMSHVLEFGAKGPVVTETGLVIKHSDKYVTYTMPEPTDREEYGIIFDLHHVPVGLEDIGGVIVIGSTNQYVECQTYLATGPSEIINSDDFLVDLEGMVNQGIEEKLGNRQLSDIVNEMVENSLRENGYIIDVSGEGASGFPDNPPPIPGFDDPEIPDSDPEPEIPEPSDEPSDGNPYGEQEVVEGFVDTNYRYIKIYKIKHKYFFYASADSFKWIEVGCISIDSSASIGLFLYGTENNNILQNGRFKCNNLAFYSSRFITFHGIDTTKQFEIISHGKIIIRTDGMAYLHMRSRDNRDTVINTTELPMPIEDAVLRVYPKNNYAITYAQYDLGTVYGGDDFKIMNDIRLFVETRDRRVELGETYDLGSFYKGDSYVKILVYNHDSEPTEDLKLTVIRYSPYYNGDEYVNLGLYDDAHPQAKIEYTKELHIPIIHPWETRTVYAVLFDNPSQSAFMKANDFRFKIVID